MLLLIDLWHFWFREKLTLEFFSFCVQVSRWVLFSNQQRGQQPPRL
jgi:hypothetical protein